MNLNSRRVVAGGLAYSSYKFIKEYVDNTGTEPSGLYFNKALSFLNTNLKRDGIELGLPHCWYRWGDQVVRYYMPRELKWTHEEDAYTKVEWNGNLPEYPNASIKARIDSIVKQVTETYCRAGKIQDLVDRIYDEAPFEFQRKYKQVRDFFHVASTTRTMDEKGKREVILSTVKNALESIPDDEIFKTVRDFAPTFLDLMNYCITSSEIGLGALNEISEEFWFWACYYLRLHPKAHENIGSDTVMFWNERLTEENAKFLDNFRDHVLEFSKFIPSIATDKNLRIYLDEAIEEDRQFRAMLSEFEKAVSDLGDFLGRNKKRYKFGEMN